MCEHLYYESVYFKELHQEQEYYWPTIYRAGAAEVSTITSYVYGGYVGSAVVLYILGVSWDVWSSIGVQLYWKLIAKIMGVVFEEVAGFLHEVVFIGRW